MNFRLIFLLSLFGLAMAFATVFFIPSDIEPFFWLAIFILCAYLIARECSNRYFLHGLLTSMLNSVWITSVHVLLFNTYAETHPEEMAMMADAPISPRIMMLITGPLIGVVSGLVLGLFAFIASRLVQKKPAIA